MGTKRRAEAITDRCENGTSKSKGKVATDHTNETSSKYSGEELGKDAWKQVDAAHCRSRALDSLEVNWQIVVGNCRMNGSVYARDVA